LQKALKGWTAEAAARKHPWLAHSVWEIVNHLALLRKLVAG
jgi:hypothetical protein